jgi:hypothetical protein
MNSADARDDASPHTVQQEAAYRHPLSLRVIDIVEARENAIDCSAVVLRCLMRPASRKRPASPRDALATSNPNAAECGSCDDMRRVSSDVRAPPGQKLLKLTFPRGICLLPLHNDASCGSSLPAPTDDDGDAEIARRPSSPHHAARAAQDLQLHVQCSRSSSVKNCGQQVWGASLLLAEYLWSVRHSLSCATVLEMGAGLAVPGVCISGFCREVLISDCNKVRRVHLFERCRIAQATLTQDAGGSGQCEQYVLPLPLRQQLHLRAA